MTSPLMELVEEYGVLRFRAACTGPASHMELTREADALLAEIRLRLVADSLKLRALEDENERLRSEMAGLERDKQRLDWLADPDNAHGAVSLPRRCVEANIHDMRAAIDAAMGLQD